MFYLKKYKNYLIRRLFDVVALFYKPDKDRLKKVLSFCSENIEYYQGKGDSLDNYEYIDKKIIRDNYDKFVRKGNHIKNIGLTSGTTGTPANFYRDIRSMAMEQYFQNVYFQWNGLYHIFFRGELLFKGDYSGDRIYKTVPLTREMFVSSFHVNDRTLKDLVEKLKKIPDKCLWAYPSSAFMLAEYCLRKNEKLNFKVVALSSEMLMDYQIETIEKAFNCKIKDWYGQAERVAALGRCAHGNYHEIEGYSHMEYLPDHDNMCQVTGTTLYNKLMPLVRYNVHDLVELSPEPCPCGHTGKNIVKIHGRQNSYVELPNGKLHETALAFLFKGMENIIEAQIIQKKDKQVALKVVRAKEFNEENERVLVENISRFIPQEMFTLHYVDRIERDARGKFRYVINEGAIPAGKV